MEQSEASPALQGAGGRLALMTLIIVVLPSLGLLWASSVARAQVESRALAGLTATGQATSRQEEQAWRNALRVIEAGASRASVQESVTTPSGQPKAAEAAANILASGPNADVRIYNASGSLIGSAGSPGAVPTPVSPQLPSPEAIGDPVTTGSKTARQVDLLIQDANHHRIGRLVVDVDMTQLLSDPGTIRFGKTGSVFLVTPAGRVIAGSTGLGQLLQSPDNLALVAAGKPATARVYSPFYHRLNVESYEPVPGQNLGILTTQAQSEVLAGADTLAHRLRLAAVGFGLLALLLSILIRLVLNRRARNLAASELRLAASRGRGDLRLRQFLDAMPVGVFVVSSDGRPYYVNQEAERLLGRGIVPGANLEGLPAAYNAYVAGTDRLYPSDKTPQALALQGKSCHIDDVEILHWDKRVPIEAWGTPVFGEDGSVEYAIAAFADVSERKRAAGELQLLGAITAKMAEGVALIQVADGTIAYANESLESMFGYDPGEMVGLPVHALDAPEDRPDGASPMEVAAAITAAVTTTGRWEGELRNIRKDGTTFWCALNISMFDHPQLGRVSISVHTDITARKLAQDAQAHLASIVAASHDAILAKTLDGIVTNWNRAAERLFGYTSSEIIGSSIDVLIPPEARAAEVQARREVVDGTGPGQYETIRMRKDGSTFPASVTLSPIPDSTGRTVGIAAIYRDITERRQAEAALREREELLAAARDQALEASRLKSQFLANMSHEIRTPMNGVLGMAHVLLGTKLDATQRGYVLNLRDSGQNLLAVINDILDFSKVEAGRLELEERDFNLVGSLESVISVLASPARDRGLDLSLELCPDLPTWVRGDPLRLRQILINIVGNAVKFTNVGSVKLSVRRNPDGSLHFEVTDTGIGIEPSARARLLDPFSQADASTTRRFGGTGLGLAISKQLVELMHGTLDFESEPGRGSRFWFDVALPTPDPTGPGELSVETVEPLLGPPAPTDSADTAILPVTVRMARGRRILVADDAEINREVSRALLEDMGYHADLVTNGAEAVEAVQQRQYYAVLMDCLMPVMDGYEATETIRRIEGDRRHTPIIALTAAAMSGDRQRCLEAGMDDYVSKPLDPAALTAALARCRLGRMPPDGGAITNGDAPGPSVQDDTGMLDFLGSLKSKVPAKAFDSILAQFLLSTPALMGELRAAIQRQDIDLMRSLAHKLKGGVASMGAIRLSDLAAQMMQLDPADPVKLDMLAGQAEEEFSRVRAVVAELSSSSPSRDGV